MNKGIRRATGEWVCFLNSGDVFVDNTVVEKVAAAIAESTGKPEIVYGNRLAQKPDGSYKEKVAGKPCNSHRMYFCHQSAFVRLPLLRKYTFDENHKMSADLKFFKQCYYNNHIFHHLPFPTIIYDRTGISKSERIRGLKDNIAVVREMDHGIWKKIFLLRLNLVIFWRRILGKK